VKIFIDEFPIDESDRGVIYKEQSCNSQGTSSDHNMEENSSQAFFSLKTDNLEQSCNSQGTSSDHNKPSDMAITLNYIEENSSQDFVSLKTASLLDTVPKCSLNFSTSPSPHHLRMHIEKYTKYKLCLLNLRMRNCNKLSNTAVHITTGGSSNNPMLSNMTMTGILDEATSSTIPGEKPTCILTSCMTQGTSVNYTVIRRCLKQALDQVFHLPPAAASMEHLVILCGEEVRSLGHCCTLYDGGVRTYNWSQPSLYHTSDQEKVAMKKDVTAWLSATGGILATHNELYQGMEAPSVIFITKEFCGEPATRSALLRAVARLVVITEKLKKTCLKMYAINDMYHVIDAYGRKQSI